MKLPVQLSHVDIEENVITIDSFKDLTLVTDWLREHNSKFTIEQVTISRCLIHVKTFK